MIFVKPIAVTESNLTSSIPEPDASVGEIEWTAGTYTLGTRRVVSSTHSVYEVVADPSTSDSPLVGVAATPQTWVYVGPTNKYKMFDEANNTQSVSTDLTVSIVPGNLANSVACFNVDCQDITVNAYSPTNDLIYTSTVVMIERPSVNGWYNYFYSSFSATTRFALLDLPPITNGRIEIVFTGTDAAVGTCVVGKQVMAGAAQWGSTGVELLDFTDPQEDQFGNVTYTQGFTAKLVNYDIQVDTPAVDSVFTEFNNLGKTHAVFVGNESNISDTTLSYGYVRDFNLTYSNPAKSSISLTVRGLV